MVEREEHGFDLGATQRRLEDWWLENVSSPVGCGVTSSPRGRSESIRWLMIEHWGEHGVHMPTVSTPRCFAAPCPVLGVAFALLEIGAYRDTLLERKEIAWLEAAKSMRSISDSMRAELLARAEHWATTSMSRAVEIETAGRPKRMLAQAVAQHLRRGGLAYSKVAALMDATEGATSKRCKVRDVRSLAALVWLPSGDAPVEPGYYGPSKCTAWRVAVSGAPARTQPA